MTNQITKLKRYIHEISLDPEFIHHKWFTKWHLEIVEQISTELCEKYPTANKDIVNTLVWIHDYSKIIDYDKQHNPEMLNKTKDLLIEFQFEPEFIKRVISELEVFESKMETDLNQASIEVQIVSSADAASHFFGPFYPLHWYEHPEKTVEQLLQANRNKLNKDWDRKITLPEVKDSLKEYKNFIEVLTGDIPDKIIK